MEILITAHIRSVKSGWKLAVPTILLPLNLCLRDPRSCLKLGSRTLFGILGEGSLAYSMNAISSSLEGPTPVQKGIANDRHPSLAIGWFATYDISPSVSDLWHRETFALSSNLSMWQIDIMSKPRSCRSQYPAEWRSRSHWRQLIYSLIMISSLILRPDTMTSSNP